MNFAASRLELEIRVQAESGIRVQWARESSAGWNWEFECRLESGIRVQWVGVGRFRRVLAAPSTFETPARLLVKWRRTSFFAQASESAGNILMARVSYLPCWNWYSGSKGREI